MAVDPCVLVDNLVAQGLPEPLCWEALELAGGPRDGMAALLRELVQAVEGDLAGAMAGLRYDIPKLGEPPADADDFRHRLGVAEAERDAPRQFAGAQPAFLLVGLLRARPSVCTRCGRTRRCWHLFSRRIPIRSVGCEASTRNEAYVERHNELLDAHVRATVNPAFARESDV